MPASRIRDAKRVVIINETLARAYGTPQAAVGKLISGGPGESAEIVGVVKDSKYWSLGEENVAFAYMALAQSPTRELTFSMRTKGASSPPAQGFAVATGTVSFMGTPNPWR